VSDTQTRLDAAQREVESQMSAKLEAQQALMVIVEALDLKLSDLGNGWKEATPKILARVATIVDEAERGFSERDALAAELERVTAALRDIAKSYTEDDLAWALATQALEAGGDASSLRFGGEAANTRPLPASDPLAGGARAAQENKMKGSG
jgi:hypothetical protein